MDAVTRPGHKRLRTGCFVLAAFACVGIVTWLGWTLFHGCTSAEVERLIQHEVPPGCNQDKVRAWFNDRGILHRYFEGTAGTSSFNIDLGQRIGLRPEDVGGVEQGFIPESEANEHFLFPSDISIYFVFDKQGRLAGHLVDSMIYGP
jgi:hypothetical protein